MVKLPVLSNQQSKSSKIQYLLWLTENHSHDQQIVQFPFLLLTNWSFDKLFLFYILVHLWAWACCVCVCSCVHVLDCASSGVNDGHTRTAAVLQPPPERCCTPAVADPDSSCIEVKINSPDSPVCLSEDDGLHTFLLCTQVLRLLTLLPSPFPFLFFITFILHLLSSSSFFLSLSLPFLSWWHCFLLALFLVRGHVCLMMKGWKEEAETSSLSSPPFHPFLSPFPLWPGSNV